MTVFSSTMSKYYFSQYHTAPRVTDLHIKVQYRPDATYNACAFKMRSHAKPNAFARASKRVYMYKSLTRNAFTCLIKCVCTPGEKHLHVWQNAFAHSCMRTCVHYTLHLGGAVFSNIELFRNPYTEVLFLLIPFNHRWHL